MSRNSPYPGNPTGFGNISSDGRSIAMTEWETADGDLVVHDLPTGQVKRLELGTCGPIGKTCGFAEDVVFSQDNRQVAYSWYESSDDKVAEHLRVISNEVGAKPRILLRSPQFRVWPNAWSSDGKSVFVHISQESDRTWQIGRVSVADGSVTILKSIGWRIPNSGALRTSLSPDGRYLAYSILAVNPPKGPPAAPESTDQHIYLLATDGSSETEIVKTAAVNQGPLWTPDGAYIVFTSNLSGKSDLWAIAVRNGKAQGSPFLLRRDIGDVWTLGMTSSGSYSYVQRTHSVEEISIAEFRPGGQSRIEENFVGMNPSWSPDGKALAFSRHKQGNDFVLVLRSLETRDEKVWERTGLRALPPRWSQSGTSFVTRLFPPSNPQHGAWNSVDIKTGEFQNLVQANNFRAGNAAPSPDGRTLYVLARDPANSAVLWDRIVAIDVGSGQEKQTVKLAEAVPQTPSFIGFALSPDGQRLAIVAKSPQNRLLSNLAVVGVDGTGYREIYGGFPAANNNDKVAWSKDGRSILFAANPKPGSRDWRIMRIGIEGGTPEFTGLLVKDLSTFDLSPDGTRIAFSKTARTTQNYWAIDNLTSFLKNSQ
jgi:Tol biopolymer transport system component